MITQNNMLTKILIAALALIALAVAGATLFLAPTVNAAGRAETVVVQDDDAPDAETRRGRAGDKADGRRAGMRHGRGDKVAFLADVLGVSAESLEASLAEGKTIEEISAEQGMTMDDIKAAYEAESAAKMAEAVANGDITQEEADAKTARIELKAIMSEIYSREVKAAVLADILGVSVAEVETAHEDRALNALVEASGLTREEIQEAMQAKKAEILAEAVADGTITQEQADALNNGEGCNKGRHRHGRGGNHDGRKNRPSDAPTVETNA